MKHSILSLGLFLTLSISHAQTPDVSAKLPSPILETIYSEVVDQTYKIFISLPLNYSPQEKSYPVLYYLDAWTYTDVLNSAVNRLTYYNHINPVILVGISYETNFKGKGKVRTRDYVPSLESTDTVHRADDFLQFIKTELIPHIESKYAVNKNDRGLIGHSYGGLFCAWVLRQEPELFQKMGISSPSLEYEDNALFNDEKLLTNIKDVKDLEVLISCGALELKKTISNSDKLFNLLKSNENIRISNLLFDSENHYTVSMVAYNRALTFFYLNQYKFFDQKSYEMYYEGNYEKSSEYLLKAFQVDPEKITIGDRFGLAYLYVLTGKLDAAFEQLYIIAERKNYKDYEETLLNNKSYEPLHTDKRWGELVDFYKKLKD